MKLLMHICCAPCSALPIKTLSERGVSLTGFWFNPNIEPEEEHARRRDALAGLQSLWGLDIRYSDYQNHLYTEAVRAHHGIRCEACYSVRMSETARAARSMGMDAFTTSQLISPYQKHDMVIAAGNAASEVHRVRFHYEDFRPLWRESRKLARELGLYSQNYCACLASKAERESEHLAKAAAR